VLSALTLWKWHVTSLSACGYFVGISFGVGAFGFLPPLWTVSHTRVLVGVVCGETDGTEGVVSVAIVVAATS